MLRSLRSSKSPRRFLLPSLAAFTLIISGGAIAAPADSSFDGLLGAWSGSGQVRYQSGDTEGIRCNAYYTGGGPKLGLAIRCKSASNDIEIRGALTHQGEKVSGTWEERTFNASGEASGRMAAGRLNLSIAGGGFSGTMSVSYSGASANRGHHDAGHPDEKRQRDPDQGLTAVPIGPRPQRRPGYGASFICGRLAAPAMPCDPARTRPA